MACRRDWFTSRNLLIVARRDVLVSDFAAGELARRTGKIIKQSKKLEVPDTRGRHKLRIAIKKVRYPCEFFESVYEGRKVERRRKVFTTTFEGIQSGLSRLNDMQVHCKLAHRFAHSRSGVPEPDRKGIRHWIADEQRARRGGGGPGRCSQGCAQDIGYQAILTLRRLEERKRHSD